MSSILADLRYALRRMLRSPGFTAVALLSLALGIGANTALFSLVDEVILKEPPYRAPEQLLNVYTNDPSYGDYGTLSYPDYEEIRDREGKVFSSVSASQPMMVQRSSDGTAEMLPVEMVSGTYFTLLGVEAEVGRVFRPEEGRDEGADPVVVLSHGYWERAFGGDPGAVGSSMELNGHPYTIVGVAPEWYKGTIRGFEPDLYAPISMTGQLSIVGSEGKNTRHNQSTFARARLRQGVTLAQGRAALDALAGELARDYPDTNRNTGFTLVPTLDVAIHPELDRIIFPIAGMLMVVVALVLLITCANLAGFLLARARSRRKEVAVRLAMGAGRGRLIQALLTETLLLALLGGVAGIGLAAFLLRGLARVDLPSPVPITLEPTLNATVLGYSLLATLLAGLLFGLAPVLQATNPDLAPTLKDEGRTTGGPPKKGSLRDVLVAGQVAVSLVLLVAAGLFLRSLRATQRVDPGFGHAPTAISWIGVPVEEFTEEEARLFFQSYEERVRQLPGVQTVGMIENMPLNGTSTSTSEISVPGVEPPPGQDGYLADRAVVDPSFFPALGIPILSGRDFGPQDTPDGQRVAIVSETTARRFWPGGDPVGSTFTSGGQTYVVVGVAGGIKVRSLGEAPRLYVYLPFSQRASPVMYVVARTAGPAAPLLPRLAPLALEVDRRAITFSAKTLEEHLGFLLLPARISALLLTLMGALALALAAIGLYGIVSYSVVSRTRELGIRVAVGADRSRVVASVLKGGLRLVAIGGGAGLVLAFLLARLLQGLVFQVRAFDPLTFVAVPLFLGAVAFLAAYIPSLRASRVDPVKALKTE